MDITEYDEFYKWYKANERRFHCSQMTEVQIAYSAYLHGIEQSHKPVVMQAEVSDGAKGAAVASEGQGEANTCAVGKHGPIKKHGPRIYCGTCLAVLLRV